MERTQVEPSDDIDYALRAAACLGALGYSPHEVVCMVADQLGVDHAFVAELLKSRGHGSVIAAA